LHLRIGGKWKNLGVIYVSTFLNITREKPNKISRDFTAAFNYKKSNCSEFYLILNIQGNLGCYSSIQRLANYHLLWLQLSALSDSEQVLTCCHTDYNHPATLLSSGLAPALVFPENMPMLIQILHFC